MSRLGLTAFNTLHTPVGELCPWMCREEFELVFSWLFSSDKQLVRKGVGRLAAWRARMDEFPLGLDLTSILLQCQFSRDEAGGPAIHSHCSALTRFVNGVSDMARMQRRGLDHRSIASSVGLLGVPAWVVSLRHNGTHGQLPSLSEFQAGINLSLNWMKANYWLPQVDTLGRKLEENSGEQQQQQQQNQVAPVETVLCEDVPSGRSVPQSRSTTWKLTKGLFSYKNELTNYLAKAEHDDLVQLLKRRRLLYFSPTVKYSVTTPAEAELAAFPFLNITDGNLQQWRKRLLKVVEINSTFKLKLIAALMATMHNHCPAIERDYLASWLGPLLRDSYLTETEEESGVEIISIDDKEQLLPGELNWREVAAAASAYPGYYSFAIMNIVVKHLKTKKPGSRVKEKMLYLSTLVTLSDRIGYDHYIKATRSGKYEEEAEKAMAAINARCPPASSKKTSPFTKKRARPDNDSSSSSSSLKASKIPRLEPSGEDIECEKWTRVENMVEWLQTPLGLCPGQTLSPTMFDLPDSLDSLSVTPPSTPRALSASSRRQAELSKVPITQRRFTPAEIEQLRKNVRFL